MEKLIGAMIVAVFFAFVLGGIFGFWQGVITFYTVLAVTWVVATWRDDF